MEVTQPAIAEQIRQLERYLQVDLFVRLGRGIRLTQAGEEFVVHARRVVAAAEEAEKSVAEMRTLLGGTVTFGAFGAPAHYRFAELIRVFAAAHPAVRLRIKGRNSSETANAVRAGEIEAGLVVLPIDDDGIDVVPVARDEVLFVSSDPAQVQAPKTLEEFVTSPLVLYEVQYAEFDPTRRQLAARAQASGTRLEAHFEVEHLDTALQLTSTGLANTYVPRAVTPIRGVSGQPLHLLVRAADVRHVRDHHASRDAGLARDAGVPAPGNRAHDHGREAGPTNGARHSHRAGWRRGSVRQDRQRHAGGPPRTVVHGVPGDHRLGLVEVVATGVEVPLVRREAARRDL